MWIFQTVFNSPTIKPNLSFVNSKFIVAAVTEPELYQMLRLCLSWLELCNVVIGVAKHFVGASASKLQGDYQTIRSVQQNS